MKKCLDCKYLKSSMLEDKKAPEMFQKILYLECLKYNHSVVGYDRKGENGDCTGFEERK